MAITHLNMQCRQQGLSLIELMISITLGMILIAAATATLLDTKRGYSTVDNVNRAQESGRIALNMMVKHARLAGYLDKFANTPAPALEDFNVQVVNKTVCGSTDCSNGNGGGTTLALTKANSDILALAYDVPSNDNGTIADSTDDFDTLCNGTVINASSTEANLNDVIVTRFLIQSNAANTINSLACEVVNARTNTKIGNTVNLVDGVDAMQILYGVKKQTDATVEYKNADGLTEDEMLNDIVSLKIALLVSDGLAGGKGGIDKKSRTFALLDGNDITFNDSKKRYLYSTTVYLNNFSTQK